MIACRDPLRPPDDRRRRHRRRRRGAAGRLADPGPRGRGVRGTRSAELTGAAHAVAFANGTAALHGAALAAGSAPGDLVVTSPLSFVGQRATAPATSAPTPALRRHRPDDARTSTSARVPDDADALVAVHYAGLPVDLSRLAAGTRVVIEDAAHALGAVDARRAGRQLRPRRHGMLLVPPGEADHHRRGRRGHDQHRRARRAAAAVPQPRHRAQRPSAGGWYYEIVELGFNYRLTDLQAALGTGQLRQARAVHRARRNELADRYRDAAGRRSPWSCRPAAPPGSRHGYHLFPIRVAERARVFDGLPRGRHRRAGALRPDPPPPRLYRPRASGPATSPTPMRPTTRLISIPMHPGLTDDDQDRVVAVLADLTT